MFILPKIQNFYVGAIAGRGASGLITPIHIGRTFTNLPVNMDLVVTYDRTMDFVLNEYNTRDYVLNEYKTYNIVFFFHKDEKQVWYFETEEKRNEVYDKLITLTVKEYL